MNSLRSLAVIAVVAVVGVGLYLKMNGGPEPEPPEDFSGTWGTPPTVELPHFANGDTPDVPVAGGMSPSGTSSSFPDSGPVSATPPAFSPSDSAVDRVAEGAPPAWNQPSREAVAGGATGGGPGATAGSLVNGGPQSQPYGLQDSARTAGGPRSIYEGPDAGVSEAATSPAAPPGEGSAAPVDPQSPSINDLVGRGANAFAAARQSAEEALSRGHLAETHLLLSRWYGDPTLSLDDERQLIDLLGQLAGTVIYSTEHLLEPAYQVQAGETLETIAEKYRIPGQLLARINGLDLPHDVAPGQALKVVRGPFSAIISLEKRELALMVGGYYAGRFRVGLGAERSNMEGHWVVRHKAINPTYYGRDRVIDADDPSNPLGEHWIGLGSAEEEGTVQPFGIHGTYDPQSLDRDDPRGYIRLSPSDARDVHDILSIGSKVVIRK